MGHSSKAGENIFWAMNRNKPGIIKRILNALERFIARIRGKDAYLAVEQRQAAERLRDMLTGELKRAYGTDVKGEAAVESDGGKRHSLAGQYSQTAKLNSLSGAVHMNENGTPMDTIRARTGWWLGKDGKWRYEIDDSALSFDRNGYTDNAMYLADYVRHDKLFAAYPWLRGVKLKIVDVIAGNENLNGLYNHHNDTIYLKDGRTDKQMKSTLLHELQHVIQEYEGFATGANPNAAAALLLNSAYNDLKRDSRFAKIKSPDEKMRIVKQYIERTTGNSFESQAQNYYYTNYGEQESRAVQERYAPTNDTGNDQIEVALYHNDGVIYDVSEEIDKAIDNLKEMGYNEKQVNSIIKRGIQNADLSGSGSESANSQNAWRRNNNGATEQSRGTGNEKRLGDGVRRRGDNQGTSETESSGRGVQRVLNEVSKPEKRFSLSSADTDIYSRIFDMQREETELTNRIREIEKSDAFKKANDDLSKAIDSDNIAEGMKAYQAWRKESGYADLVDRRDALRAELEEIRTKANNDAVSKAINEERTAIEKSGLSEADYFRKQAVKEFGYTPYFYDAGYIMPNGKMLNFSGEKGRHYGSRGQDHRAIGTIYADTNGTDALVRFMNDGNIRIMAETPGLDISASTEPSKEQYTTIRRFANEFSDGGYFAVDLSDENGKTVGTLEYEGNINPTRIVNDIKHFYETGEVREQSGLDRFRYSLTRANDEYMKAVESGDTEEQRRLVDEAAKESGYDRLFWHGSKNGGGFTEFRDWSYFTENKKYASRYAKAGDKGSLYEVYANLGNAFDTRKPECREIFDKMRSEYGLSKVQESGLPDWTDGYDIAEFIDENGLDYDSIILDEGGDLVDGKPVSRGFSYVIRSSEQVKSADPITYDDSGNVIPLTERFDSGNRDIRWSLAGTTDGRPVAVIDKDILDGVPESEWKSVARKAISEGFPDGIAVQGKNIRVNQTTRREYTKSDYTQWLFNHSKGVFADKMRAAAKLDDVVLAATNWTKDGGLKHPRKDNFVDFGRGNVLMSIGGNKYSAEVILAYPQVGAPVLYDVVTLNPDSFDLINEKAASANANAATSGAHTTRFSSDISAPNTVSLTQNTPDVNSQYMREGEKDSSSERHSLVKSAQSELKALQKENEKLRQDVDDLKQELQLTHGRKLSRDALISSIQKILIDGYGVKLSAKELYPHVTNLYDMFYNNTVDGKRLKKDERVDTMRIIEEMDKIVDAVIENAVGVDDTYVEMKKLLPELRNTKLVVPVDARADAAQSAGFENWAEFRKANFGRVGFANEGLPVDTYYMELSERYPELFPDGITNPGEQAAHIADVVNTIRESGINEYQLYDIEDERIRTSIKNDVMDIIGNAEKLQTFADRAAQKVEDTKLAEAMHYGADIAKLKRLNAEKVADIKAENRKRLSDMRRKYQDRVESVRERYAEARANRSEKQKQTVLRNKVLRKYTEASSMLDRPTTENHFTEAMRKPLMEFLAAVDITTGKSVAKQGIYDRILRVIEAANNATSEGGKNGLDIAETDLNVQEKQLIVDSGLLERMAAWVEANQGKKLTELSSAQLFDQIVSNEPPVGYVHLDLLQQPYFAADTVRISYEQHTEKNLRLDSRASVILAVIRLADSAGTSFSNTILSQA